MLRSRPLRRVPGEEFQQRPIDLMAREPISSKNPEPGLPGTEQVRRRPVRPARPVVTRPVEPRTSADPTKAEAAFERAVAFAEAGVSSEPVVLVCADDVRALGASKTRIFLDRVMMGTHADLGLDALLVGGLLDALLPEVKAMVAQWVATWSSTAATGSRGRSHSPWARPRHR